RILAITLRTRQVTWIVCCLWCFAILAPVRTEAEAPPVMRRILLLHQEGATRPFRAKLDAAFVEALRSVEVGLIDLYEESVETERFPGPGQARLVHDYLKEKYAGLPI